MIRHIGRATLHGLATILAATVVILGLASWRLASGPLSLSFLSPHLAAALSGEAEGYAIQFDDTVLALGAWPDAVDLRLARVRILDDEDRLLLAAPEVSVDLSLPRLLVGEIAPIGLTAVRPLFRIIRSADGHFVLGSPDSDSEAASGWDQIFADLGPRPNPDRPLARLARVAVSDGTVTFEDQRLAVAWRAEHVEIDIAREVEGISLEAAARLPFGDPYAHLDLVLHADRDVPYVTATVRLGGVRPALIAPLASDLGILAGFDVAVGAVLDARMATDGRLLDATFEAFTGPGSIDPGGLFGAPRTIGGFSVHGHVDPSLDAVVLDSFALDVGEGRLTGSMMVTGLDGEGRLDLATTVENITIANVLDFWPPNLGTGARTWLAEHLRDARVTTGEAGLAAEIAALGRDESPLHGLTITLDVEDATVDYKPPLAPAEGARGHVAIAGYALSISELSGAVGGLSVTGGRVEMPSLDGTAGLTVDLPVTGPLSAALTLAADPTLGLDGIADIAARGAEAGAVGALKVGLPRLDGLSRDDVSVGVTARLERLALPDVVPGFGVNDGAVDVTVDGTGVAAQGNVVINGVPLAAVWSAEFAGAGRWSARLKGTVDDAGRAALAVDVGDWVAGPIGADLAIAGASGEPARLRLQADLTPAELRLGAIDWSKPAGVPGLLDATWLDHADGGTVVETLTLEAGDLAAQVEATIGPGGSPLRVEARRLRLGRNDLSGTLTSDGDGYVLAFDAAAVDASPYMEDVTGDDEAHADWPPIRLQGSIGALYLRPDLALTRVTVDADHRDDRWHSLAFTGTMPGGAPLVIAIVPEAAGRSFSLDAADAGDALRLFDVFDTARGGRLEISAEIDDSVPDGPATGRLVMTDFTIRDAPILGKLLALGSFTAIQTLMAGEGIPFKKAKVPFVKQGGLITLGKSRAWGGAIGLNAEGTIDLDTDTLDLRGTLVPAYSINSVFGAVPLLGELLVGGEGEGLFAATYAVKGPRDDPQVLVNPLATLAPGFLRDIFQFDEGPPAEGATDETVIER